MPFSQQKSLLDFDGLPTDTSESPTQLQPPKYHFEANASTRPSNLQLDPTSNETTRDYVKELQRRAKNKDILCLRSLLGAAILFIALLIWIVYYLVCHPDLDLV